MRNAVETFDALFQACGTGRSMLDVAGWTSGKRIPISGNHRSIVADLRAGLSKGHLRPAIAAYPLDEMDWPAFWNNLNDFAHMHCNRFGLSRGEEHRFRAICRAIVGARDGSRLDGVR